MCWFEPTSSPLHNGHASVVEEIPGGQAPRDVDAALKGIDDILAKGVRMGGDRSGELTMQRMIRMVGESTRKSEPPHSLGLQIWPETDNSRLPIVLFLYGDHCATFPPEAHAIISDVLETSGMIFGLSDTMHIWGSVPNGQIWNLVHYYSRNTGGQYYSA